MSSRNFEKDRPVAVTGIGIICPLGITAPSFWDKMLKGTSGIRPITKFDPRDCVTQIGGQLPEEYFEFEKEKTSRRFRKQTVRTTRVIRLCAQEAIQDSALDLESMNADRCGVIIGTSGSSVRSPEDLEDSGSGKFRIIREMLNALPVWISLDYGFRGPSFTLSSACSSGAYAISRAFDLIRYGTVDVAIAGGVDNLLTKNNIERFSLMKILHEGESEPEKAMKPFDRARNGFVLSDGGCSVVLESYDHAIERNARVYAWMKGYASFSDISRFSNSEVNEEGMAQTMEAALVSADLPKERVGYVSANGVSTMADDACETKAIKKTFGRHAYNLLVSAHKSMVGHTVGASSALSFATAALALSTQKIPPTVNYQFPDPECDLNYVPNKMVEAGNLEAAVSNSFSFAGHNSVIVLTKAS